MQRLAVALTSLMLLACCAEASSRLLLQTGEPVRAALRLSRAGKSDRCVAAITLTRLDGRPIGAARAVVQWRGDAATQTVSSSPSTPSRLFATSNRALTAASKGCALQLVSVSFGDSAAALTAGSLTADSTTTSEVPSWA